MMKAMRKVDCQTTQEEAIRILQNLKYLSVAMLNEDGSPYNVVVDCVYDDGKIYFHSANEGQKLDCIRHDPRVCASGLLWCHQRCANSTTRYASVVIHGKGAHPGGQGTEAGDHPQGSCRTGRDARKDRRHHRRLF